jgi:hypothetical protein
MGLWDKLKQGAKKTGEKIGEANRQYQENKILKAEQMKERKKSRIQGASRGIEISQTGTPDFIRETET